MADFPDSPCASCPRAAAGLPMPCRAQITKHARFCELAAAGDEGYIRLLSRDHDPAPRPSPPPEHAEILARRATKPRLPLGVRAPTPPQGRR